MMTQEEQERVFKAINNVSKKIMEIQKKLDEFILSVHKESVDSISITEDAIIELASLIDEVKGGQE